MIEFSANIQTVLATFPIESFYMLRISNKNGTAIYSSTDYFMNISLSNGYTYTADALLLSVDAPQLTSAVDREQYKIVLSDPSFSQATVIEDNIVGKYLETRIGFINQTTGLPYLTASDTLIVYKGRIESAGYIIDSGEIGESKLQITGSSPISNLDQKNGIYLSKEMIRNVNGNDSCCDQLYEGSGTLALKWGKR
jgi:hypothetical protein